MMPNKNDHVYLFVDNSNIWIEGKRIAEEKQPGKGESWRLDFGRLMRFVEGNRRMYGAKLYGSRPPPNDSVWNEAKRRGFAVTVLDRNTQGKEKAVDSELCLDVMETLTMTPATGTIAIVAGDGDYQTLPARAVKYGWDMEFYYWSHAANKIKNSVESKFINLDDHILDIGRYLEPRGAAKRVQ